MGWLRWNCETHFGRNLGCSHSETLSLPNVVKAGFASTAPSSPTLLAEVTPTRNMTFVERREKESEGRRPVVQRRVH